MSGNMAALVAQEEETKLNRASVPQLDEILGVTIPVLDHGFIRVIDYMGDDNAIVQAARVSYGKGTKQISQDRGLIRYLLRHAHTTPFEMCEIKFHIKLPIFVARQWIRHRTANVNEYSARYSLLEDQFYIPEVKDLTPQSTLNKQGRSEGNHTESAFYQQKIREASEASYQLYEELLNQKTDGTIIHEDKQGLARELARMVLPANVYTQWYWKVDLHNLLHFLYLRADSHAQYEIRVYALKMLEIVQKWVPHTFEAFQDYKQNASLVSSPAKEVLKRLLKGEPVAQDQSGLSLREWQELEVAFGPFPPNA